MVRSERFSSLIRLLSSVDIDPLQYDGSHLGAQSYLDEIYRDRESNFSLLEIITPNNKELAFSLGFSDFLVPPIWYPRMACLRWIADDIRDLVKEPVSMKNYYRPAMYNEKVGGAKNSAHVLGCAIDLEFQSRKSIRKSLVDYLEHIWLSPYPYNAGMGLGVGSRRIHIDIFSPSAEERISNGKSAPRWWAYPSDKKYTGPKSRWKLNE